jgi:ornithine carbamoyltransferase
MALNLRGRSFITLKDYTPQEIEYLLNLSADLKAKKRSGVRGNLLEGKNVCLIFEKTSTRTRTAFEVGAFDEGANVTFLTNSQMGKKETAEDTAKVLGRSYDGIEFRGFKQETVEDLATHAGVPVWNGLTDMYHPTQILADFLTVKEHIFKPLNKIKFVFVGDTRNNMGNSLMIGAAKMGMHFVALAPKVLWPEESLVTEMNEVAKETGAIIELSEDIDSVKDADVIYTDVWVSMGEEDKAEERMKLLTPYRVNSEMMELTDNPGVIFMHCLPAHRDDEATSSVMDGKHSVIFDEAENRLHAQKAIMRYCLGK